MRCASLSSHFLRLVGLMVLLHAFIANALVDAPLFSSRAAGSEVSRSYRVLALPNVDANRYSLVSDGESKTTVLRIDSHNAAGSVALPSFALMSELNVRGQLRWRWKIDRVVEAADLRKRSGDDYAARIYVFFDVPIESLGFIERNKIRLARLVSGSEVPTTALCYVWDNKSPVGTTVPSPYTARVRKIVLQSGKTHAGQWMTESRDVAADFRTAFGLASTASVPRVTGVAVGSDTDQTRESVTTWFGDVGVVGAGSSAGSGAGHGAGHGGSTSDTTGISGIGGMSGMTGLSSISAVQTTSR
jgi:hypothetical protein